MAPRYSGDPEAALRLEASLPGAMVATSSFGPWPPRAWEIHLHPDAASFEATTSATPQRAAAWIGDTLHLRPWEQLRRRNLGAILRHEFTHRRLAKFVLRRWEEEARCLYAEQHARPPERWPTAPLPSFQERLDRALAGGSTREQAWAYKALRAWTAREPIPGPPTRPTPMPDPWRKEAMLLESPVYVTWPPERMPASLEINGEVQKPSPGYTRSFSGQVRFGEDMPFRTLSGTVQVWYGKRGWRLSWKTDRAAWIAAATAGELGQDAPFEAKRALAAVLDRWLEAHPRGNHPDASLCALTHCAVIRGDANEETRQATDAAPRLDLNSRWAFFCGSKGGAAMSAREVWGQGPSLSPKAESVPNDPWASWERSFSPRQVSLLKASVRPGLAPGQKGLMLGVSGPYPVEYLRIAAGRAFGWKSWPSNACEASLDALGNLNLRGHGWGHNVGLCLATAIWQARQGKKAEVILADAFGEGPSEN